MARYLVIGAVALITAAAPARADTPKQKTQQAYQLAQQGMKRSQAGDYQGALVLFRRALALHLRSDYQCNVGGAYYKLRRWPEAHLYLGMCLSRTADLNDAAYVKTMSSVYAKVEAELQKGEYGAVSFQTRPTGATVQVSALPGDVEFTTPRVVWLPTGTHKVELRAANHKSATGRVTVTKGKKVSFRAAMDVVVVAKRRSTAPAYASLGIAAAGLLGGLAYNLLLRDTIKKAEPLDPTSTEYMELEKQYNFRRIMSYSLFGVGGAAAVIGAYLLIRAGSKPERANVGATFTPCGGSVWARWQF